MVRALLGLVAGGAVLCGCLVANPPDFEELVEHAPVIVNREPASAFVALNLDDERELSSMLAGFVVVVRDFNLDDDLRYRWFLDFNPVRPACGLIDRYTVASTGEPLRTIPQPFSFPVNDLEPGRCHRLTLAVTDGDWEGCAGVTEQAHRVSADWWLVVYNESTQAREVQAADCLAKAGPLQ